MIRILTSLVCVCVLAAGLAAQGGKEWYRADVWEGPGDALSRTVIGSRTERKTSETGIRAETFTPGNIVVCRVGNGGTSLSSNAAPVFLDEFTPNGVFVSTVAMPTVRTGASFMLTLSGTNPECQITRSVDGRYVFIAGYPKSVGSSSVSSSLDGRVFGRVDAAGTVDTTTITYSIGSSHVRGAASIDGSGIWAATSAGGVRYLGFGGEQTAITVSNTVGENRAINIFGNQLYTSSRFDTYRVGSVGTGTPTSDSNTMVKLPGYPSVDMPGGFYMADLDASVAGMDTLYVADEGTGTGQNGGGVKKFSLVAGSWTYKGTFPASSSPSIPANTFVGLTGTVTSPNTVTLYATRLLSSGNQLVKFVDSTGYNAAPTAQPTLLSTAAANTIYRGVALAPTAPASPPTVVTSAATNATSSSGTLNGSANPNGAATTGYFRYSNTDPGTCDDSFGTRAPASGGVDLGSGSVSVDLSQTVSGLVPGTTYYYCAIAQNSGGTSLGSIQSFATAPLPSAAINNVTMSEGDSGTTAFTFTVSLSAAAGPGGVTFDIATANGTAQAGSDYTAISLTGQTIPQGNSSYEFTISVNGDSDVEPTETFFVNFTSVSGATVADGQGMGTITNDDAYPSTLVVTTAADTDDGLCDADCSLREAVAAANASPDVNTITFAGGDDNAIAADTIVLAGSELRITSDLVVSGPGADQLTIDGGAGSNRIFDVASGVDATISGVTLTGGDGVGILSDGNGGAIRAEGSLTLDGVHLTSNSASVSGGALFLAGAGPYFISNSTFSGNYASQSGAGLFKSVAADVTIVNSTFSDNSIAAGNEGAAICILGAGTTTLRSVTIYANSAPSSAAGIYLATGTLDIGNSIIAGNLSASAPELYIASGTVTSIGFNIIGDSGGDSADTNIPIAYAATDLRDLDPKLAPLANNGGTVPTHGFDNSGGMSPAIDKGNAFGLTVDGRGVSRTVDFAGIANAAGGDGTDIGAYELLAPTAAPVTIMGRVLSATGRPVSGAVVKLAGESGEPVRAVTNMFGYYRFDGVSGGEGYVLSVKAKRYSFRALFVNADADVAGLDIYAER